MFDHILKKFGTEEAVTFIVHGDGPTTVPKPAIDGTQAVIPYETEVTLPRCFFEVVRDAGYAVELVESDEAEEAEPVPEPAPAPVEPPAPAPEEPAPEETKQDETAAEGDNSPPAATEAPAGALGGETAASAGGSGAEPGSNGDGSAPAFDADKVIEGNVAAVKARLGDLTDEQLALVAAAEKDREVPRVTVASAIDAEITNRKAAKDAAEKEAGQ